MAWLLLKIEATEQTADAISDVLMRIGALSASIEDANAETAQEQAIFGEPSSQQIHYPPPGIWQQNIVTAMFDDATDVNAIMHITNLFQVFIASDKLRVCRAKDGKTDG